MDSPAAQKPRLKTEAIAGITTFFTMAYIVIVNPQILSAGGKKGMAFSGLLTA
jgi:adenine/guanine/hypoxanthine permease